MEKDPETEKQRQQDAKFRNKSFSQTDLSRVESSRSERWRSQRLRTGLVIGQISLFTTVRIRQQGNEWNVHSNTSAHLVKPVVSGTLSLRPGVMAVAMEILAHQTNTPRDIWTARTDTPVRSGPSQIHSHNKNTANVAVNTAHPARASSCSRSYQRAVILLFIQVYLE